MSESDWIALTFIIAIGALVLAEGIVYWIKHDRGGQCPPHKWIDGGDDHLVCDKCKRRPGELPVTRFHYPDKGGFA